MVYRGSSSPGGGSSGYRGAPSPDASSTPAKAKKAKPRWGAALLSNIEDFARGLGPGLVHIGRSAYNDVDLALTGESETNSFMLDDVGGAIVDDYKTRYGDLVDAGSAMVRGDFRTVRSELGAFKEQLATKPLDFILDFATVATIGGAAVGTVPAKAIATGAKVSPRAAARAGFVKRTPENVRRAELVYGPMSKEVRAGADQGLVRGVREVGAKAAREGRIREPLLRPKRTNTVLHRRDEIVEKLLGSTHLLNKAPAVGLYARAAAQSRKRPVLERAVLERKVDETQKALQWLDQDELTAWAMLHQAVDPTEYAERLDVEAPKLQGIELDLNRARRAQLTKPEVLALVQQPSKRVAKAVDATQELADDVMQPIMENVVGMRREDLLERRALPERVVAGATLTKSHPEDLQPTTAAEAAKREAARVAARRGKTREQTAGDLERMRSDRARLAERLRRVAQELVARAKAQEAARRKLRADGNQGAMRERAIANVDEALEVAPERVRHMPVPGREPSPADVELMIARMRNRLTRGQYAKARKALRSWLEELYRETRYGSSTPDAAMRQAEMRAVRAAKARRKGRGTGAGHGELMAAVDKFGLWSEQAATLATDAGPLSSQLWKSLVRMRADDAAFVNQWPHGSMERYIARAGYHPTDRAANPIDADGLADAIEEWVNESTGEGQVVDFARGVAERGDDAARSLDIEQAQGLVERARYGDPDLPANPTNDEIADGIAATLMPDDAIADIPTQKEFVDRAMQAMLRVFEDGADELADARTEFGRIRGGADRVLAEKLGIGSIEDGVDATPGDWARAIIAKLEEDGFDDGYRMQAAALRNVEHQARELGAWAFRDDRFVPDPEQVDFGTMLEFVPEIDDALRKKLETDAGSLTAKERATLRKAARTLDRAAVRVERNSTAEAVLRKRIERLEGPNRRERSLLARAEELQPVPLKGHTDLDGERYRPAEWVNPETGNLFRDEGPLAAPAGSYLPHLLPRASQGGGGIRALGSVKAPPKFSPGITKSSTGELFAAGTYENEAVALLDRARSLIRGKYASDLYTVALDDMGIPFDEATYARLGGPGEWVVANPAERAGVAAQVESLAGMFEELKGLLPEEQLTETIARLKQRSAETLGRAKQRLDDGDEGALDELLMIPRPYWDRLAGDIRESNALVRALIDRPLDVFRTLVLFSRPAYYANNIVGQHLLLAVRDPGFLPTYIRHVSGRNLEGARNLWAAVAKEPASTKQAWDAVLERHGGALHGASAGQVETSGFGAMTQRMALSGRRRQQVIAAMLRSPRTANELGAVLSDDIPRQVRFIRLMQPHVDAAKRAGFEGDDAAIAMKLLDEDPVLAERVTEQTLFDLVDYRGMSPFEKRVIRRIIPFYGWMRGLTVWAAELGYNSPAHLLALMAISDVGQDVNAEWNARTPSWMAGAVMVGDEKDGMQRVVNTQPVNPLGTLADVAMLARGAFADDPTKSLAAPTAFGQINPYAQTVLAAAFNQGKELGTPFPMLMPGQHLAQPSADRQQWRGWPAAALGGFIASTPQATLYAQSQAAEANGGIVNPTGVYQSPLSDYLLSYLGYPVRNVNLQAAAARRQRDEDMLAGEGRGF